MGAELFSLDVLRLPSWIIVFRFHGIRTSPVGLLDKKSMDVDVGNLLISCVQAEIARGIATPRLSCQCK